MRWICGECWVWGPSSTYRGIYLRDIQTNISLPWMIRSRDKSLQVTKCWDTAYEDFRDDENLYRLCGKIERSSKDIIWGKWRTYNKKRLRLALSKHNIWNWSILVQLKIGLPLLSWVSCDQCSLHAHLPPPPMHQFSLWGSSSPRLGNRDWAFFPSWHYYMGLLNNSVVHIWKLLSTKLPLMYHIWIL